MEKIESEVVIIGAGVLGLALASKLAKETSVVLVERHPRFGQEISSRNSEVVHSGIYYPQDSLKTQLCISGREKLYTYCVNNAIPCRPLGKLLVASDAIEIASLEKIAAHCKNITVPFERLSSLQVQNLEPSLKVEEALLFPRSGIVDSHQLMGSLERKARDAGALLAYQHEVRNIYRNRQGWELLVGTPGGEIVVASRLMINAAGLAAAELSNLALKTDHYQHRYCRGRYFFLSSKFNNLFHHLVYPVPPKDGLGVHITLDMAGELRLGPDVDWAKDHRYAKHESLYDCDWEQLKPAFVSAASRYAIGITPNDLRPAQIGIRPKLFLGGNPYPDFLIENHEGFIHCLGIESPGLTAALAISDHLGTLL